MRFKFKMQNIPKIKICGITNLDDAEEAVRLGADSIGFVFYDKSKRGIIPEKAKEITRALRKTKEKFSKEFLGVNRDIVIAGVFVDEEQEKIETIVNDLGIDIVQLSGAESTGYIEDLNLDKNSILKAVHIKDEASIEKVYYYKNAGVNILLDTYAGGGVYGGTGLPFDLNLIKNLDLSSVIIAGGIGPDNIKYITETVMPYGFDLSSKIEEFPGKKDYKKMSSFFDNFKGAVYETA